MVNENNVCNRTPLRHSFARVRVNDTVDLRYTERFHCLPSLHYLLLKPAMIVLTLCLSIHDA